ncbi:MAG: ribonuclease III [Eubacteriales bacterium]|nr:ribonuclease III [Eubacteriales bacterium]
MTHGEKGDSLESLQNRLSYQFTDVSLLREALTHASRTNEAPDEPCYERLEFLGDAVVELLVTHRLYAAHPDWGEGQMTRTRASVVSEPALSALAAALRLGENLRMGKGTARLGGRERPSILCDVFESVTGAVFLDGGMEAAERVILPLLEQALARAAANGVAGDYKTALQEKLQQSGERHIVYRSVSEEGPPHDRTFGVELAVDGEVLSRGEGHSKKAAQQDAARIALEAMNE